MKWGQIRSFPMSLHLDLTTVQRYGAAYEIVTVKQQEAQLMLTNRLDAFVGQSRSPNAVPFHMLSIASY